MRWLGRTRIQSRSAVVIAVLALVAALIPVAPVAAIEIADPTIIYVDNSVDGPGSGTAEDPFALLGNGLAAAAEGDTVMVAAGTYGPLSGETLPFVVPGGVTVVGEYDEDEGWQTVLTGDEVADVSASTLIEPEINPVIMTVGPEMFAGEIVEPEPVAGVVIANLAFMSNHSEYNGAGISMALAEAEIANCGFVGLSSYAGGAIAAFESTLTISESVFVDNGGGEVAPLGSEEQGAALERFGIDPAELRVDKLPAAGEAGAQQLPYECYYGGAILSVGTKLDVASSVFMSNAAGYAGGAILTDGAPATTADSIFLGNYCASLEADSVAPPSFDDPAGYVSALIDDGIFIDPFGGGAVCNVAGDYADDSSYFVLNEGDPGSAVVSFSGAVTLKESLVGGNYGAAVVAFGEGLALGGVEFAESLGVIIEPEPEPAPMWSGLDIDRAMFLGNYGRFTTYSTTSPTRITNSEYVENEAMVVVEIEDPFAEESVQFEPLPEPEPVISSIEGCTFSQNNADFTMIAGPRGGTPTTLVNTIIWGNEALDINATAEVDAVGIDAYNVDYEYGIDARIEEDCFSEDPLFANPEELDFGLSAGSPCIDTGTSEPEAVDFASAESALAWELRPWDFSNLARPIDGDGDGEELFDVGAHEYLPSGRLAGENRYETAVEISAQHFGQADAVVIATGRVFADGLSGSGLAGMHEAPILLVEPDHLPQVVEDEIVRLGASQAFILGGPVAVGTEVEDALLGMGLEVTRIGGVDRYETSAMIAEHIAGALEWGFLSEPLDIAFIARGDLYADALAVSPVAYAGRIPVLLVRPDALPEHTVDVIGELGVTSAVVLGGDVAVNQMVAAEVGTMAEEVTRIDGADRYETAANIAEWAWENSLAGFGLVGVTTGEDFADALSGGPGIGSMYGVLLLNPSDVVNEACESSITTHSPEIGTLQVLGGPAALSEDVYEYLMGLIE